MALWKPTRNAKQAWRWLERRSFARGWITEQQANLLPNEAVHDAQNIIFEGTRAVKRRGYSDRFASAYDASHGCNGVYPLYLTDGTTKLVFGADVKLYYDSPHLATVYDSQAEWDTGTKTDVETATSAGDVKLNVAATAITQAQSDDSTVVAAAYYSAQTFTPDKTCLLKSVTLSLSKQGAPPAALTVEIRTTSGGKPTATVLATETIDVADVAAAEGDVTKVLSSPPAVTASTAYALVAYTSGGNASNRYRWYYKNSNAYAGGAAVNSSDSGATWTINTTQDFRFGIAFIPTTPGTWVSPWIDVSGASSTTSGIVTAAQTTPAGTSITLATRSNSAAEEAGATAWANAGASGEVNSAYNTYIQVRATLASTNTDTPTLSKLTLSYDDAPTATELGTGFNAAAQWHMEAWQDLLIIASGLDVVQKYDGTTLAALGGTPPQFQYLCLVPGIEYLFGAGVAAYPGRLYYSDLGDAETWPALNYIDIGGGDGEDITALATLGESLVIFKEASIYILYGRTDDDFMVQRVVSGIGCIAPRSVPPKMAGTILGAIPFLSRDGVRLFDGSPNAVLVSQAIAPTLDTYNKSQWADAAGIVWRNRYYLAIAGAGSATNNRVVVWDASLQHKPWSYFTGWNISCWCVYRHYGEDVLIAGGSVVGQLFDCDEGYNDGGTAITCVLESRHEDAGLWSYLKDLAHIDVILEGQTAASSVTLNLVHDGTTSANQTLTVPAGSGTINSVSMNPVDASCGKARIVGLKLTHATLDEAFECSGYVLRYRRSTRD